MKLVYHGAEAKIYFDGIKILKERIRKNYRIEKIDNFLRKSRTLAEERILRRAKRAGLNVPEILNVNKEKNTIEMEFINGIKMSEYFNTKSDTSLFQKIGEQVSKMHEANIAHGDLTTSNIILKDGTIYLIDFGLAAYSEKIEDKAVDLHILKECLKSKHIQIESSAWKEFLKTYKQKDVLERLEKVEKRGRYK